MDQYKKAFVSVRYYMIGRSMHLALNALEYASAFHTGKRKDGITPEFFHQISIILFLRTLEGNISFPEETFAVAALHDVCEDADVGFSEIEARFGSTVARSVQLVTKKHRGHKIPPDVYYNEISKDAIASLVKGSDRINNIQTMIGVFSEQKQIDYIDETQTLILPMLKTARRTFTKQEPAYENIKMMLQSQITLIQAIHNAKRHEKAE